MIHLISYGRAHLIEGEEYKNDKPPKRLASAKSNAALLFNPTSNSVTRRRKRWKMRLSRGKLQTALPVCPHAESHI